MDGVRVVMAHSVEAIDMDRLESVHVCSLTSKEQSCVLLGGMTTYLLYPRRWSAYEGELVIAECEVNSYVLIDTSLQQSVFAASVRVASSVASIRGDIELVLAALNEDGCR